MNRVQEFELWEKNKRREMQYIKTNVTDQPQIYYMPKEHNDSTLVKFNASLVTIEEEIRLAKAAFEEDLLKIETKLKNNDYGEEDIDDEEDDDEDAFKPKSVIVKQPHKRIRDENGKTKHEPKPEMETIKVTIKNVPARSTSHEDKPAAKRQRKDSSASESSSSSSDSSDSSSDSEDDLKKLEKLKRKIKQEIKQEK